MGSPFPSSRDPDPTGPNFVVFGRPPLALHSTLELDGVCRSYQTPRSVLELPEEAELLVMTLTPWAMFLSTDANGNPVIQRCLQHLPVRDRSSIIARKCCVRRRRRWRSWSTRCCWCRCVWEIPRWRVCVSSARVTCVCVDGAIAG